MTLLSNNFSLLYTSLNKGLSFLKKLNTSNSRSDLIQGIKISKNSFSLGTLNYNVYGKSDK